MLVDSHGTHHAGERSGRKGMQQRACSRLDVSPNFLDYDVDLRGRLKFQGIVRGASTKNHGHSLISMFVEDLNTTWSMIDGGEVLMRSVRWSEVRQNDAR